MRAIEQVTGGGAQPREETTAHSTRDQSGQAAYHLKLREMSRTSKAYAHDARQPAAKGGHWVTRFGMWRILDCSARQLLVGLHSTSGGLVDGWKPGCAASSILEDEYYMRATRTRYGLSRRIRRHYGLEV